MTDSSETIDNINIQLGNIIEIKSQDNPLYENQQFFVKFINQFKIVLVEVDSLKTITIQISPNGELDDPSIECIYL